MVHPVPTPEILLVEDNEADVKLTRLHFARSKLANQLHVASTGEEAIEYLKGTNGHPVPDLVLLDLNLPGISGHEVLEFIKEDDRLRSIPVVVLTSSQAEADVQNSYRLHANAFVTKPVTLEGLGALVKSLEDFWFTMVRLPSST